MAFIPKIRRHREKGNRRDRAYIVLNGKNHTLGAWDDPAAHEQGRRLIGQYLTQGKTPTPQPKILSVAELVQIYRKWAKAFYVKRGKPTSEYTRIVLATNYLLHLYGYTAATEFDTLAFMAVRDVMVRGDLSRNTVNAYAGLVTRVFRYAVKFKLIEDDVYSKLRAVEWLQIKRTTDSGLTVKQNTEVTPVHPAVLEQIIDKLSPTVAAMAKLQRHTGMRPTEVCTIRSCDVDMSGDRWIYRPPDHKTAHRGKTRQIELDADAQAIVMPHVTLNPDRYWFSPDANKKSRNDVGECYTRDSYRRAFTRACDRAFPPPTDKSREEARKWKRHHRFSPNQIRHTAATEMRATIGLDKTQERLGHASYKTTENYAETSFRNARLPLTA